MKKVELKKYEFEYRDMSRLSALSGTSGPLGIQCREGNQWFSLEFLNKAEKRYTETLKQEIKTVVIDN